MPEMEPGHPLSFLFDQERLLQRFLLSEVLAPPVARRLRPGPPGTSPPPRRAPGTPPGSPPPPPPPAAR